MGFHPHCPMIGVGPFSSMRIKPVALSRVAVSPHSYVIVRRRERDAVRLSTDLRAREAASHSGGQAIGEQSAITPTCITGGQHAA
jgi:hypothetical protein